MAISRPATLFKNVGLPQAAMRLSSAPVKRGRTKRSCIFPRRKGHSASSAHTAMPTLLARAAAQTPQCSTPRNTYSHPAHSTLMSMFSSMLCRTLPQMRR